MDGTAGVGHAQVAPERGDNHGPQITTVIHRPNLGGSPDVFRQIDGGFDVLRPITGADCQITGTPANTVIQVTSNQWLCIHMHTLAQCYGYMSIRQSVFRAVGETEERRKLGNSGPGSVPERQLDADATVIFDPALQSRARHVEVVLVDVKADTGKC